MPQALTDYVQQNVAGIVNVLASVWVRLTNNTTGLSYVSTSVTDGNGLFTINNIPPGLYTVATGPSAIGPWTNTGDNNYEVAPTNLGWFNVMDYGAIGNGVADDTTAIQNAINAASNGGTVYFPSGTYGISSPLNVTNNRGVTLLGSGGNASKINCLAGFSGADMIHITQNFTTVRSLHFQPGSSATYSSNPAADCITISGANTVWIEDCEAFFWNGWFINAIANGSSNPFGIYLSNLYAQSGKQGIHFNAPNGTHSVAAELTNVFMNHMQAGDALFLDGVHDVVSEGFFGVLDGGASAFSCIHIKGTSAGIFFFAADCGGISGGAYTGSSYLIEKDGSNNRPNNVQFIGGITSVQGIGLNVDCDDFVFNSHIILQSQTDGMLIQGSGTNLTFINNRIQQSNLSAGTGYDVHCTNNTGRIIHEQDLLESTATTAGMFGQVNMYVRDCYIAHPTQAFSNATPHHRGNIGPGFSTTSGTPSVPASTVAFNNNRQVDCIAYITAGTSTCAVAINGLAVATLPASGVGSFAVPDGASITLTYANAPTWVWQFAGTP